MDLLASFTNVLSESLDTNHWDSITMGQCPSCGRKKVFLKTVTCNVCGKIGCEDCFTFLFRVVDRNSSFDEPWYSCSDKCFEKISTRIENQINPKEIIADGKLPPVGFFVQREILKQYASQESSGIVGQVTKRFRNPQYFVAFTKIVQPNCNPSVLYNRISKYTMLIQASHYETLREFENAAKIYKSLGMYDKAGQIRAKRDEVIVKKTDVTVNLNALLQQVKDGGIVAIYRCPHCNAKLKVGSQTTLNSLRTCEHCGSEIEAVELADFLKTVLS